MRITTLLFLMLVTHAIGLYAQKENRNNDVYVDEKGIMRWPGTNKEVQGFGINYTAPFAYAFRAANQLGVSVEKAIDADVYHFARLGFDAYRVHVWDTEISDSIGNLLDNEHLRLFDYLVYKLKQRNVKLLITPIAYWGNGWPMPDEKTPGFSHKYGKDKSLTDTGAIRAQKNYLYQFLNHVNRYTNLPYKNDPDVVAFEISNEPHHGEAPGKVTAFITGMLQSMRNTGCKKPIFYNISHSIHLADAYFKAGINGGTFQWYPTGLGFKKEIKGNLLPNVDAYKIPFAENPGFKKIAKVVYEFDAADVGRSYIYPAMARSFRTAGIQWATHFAYDPTYTAFANTEYDTHYMNLVYAPQKAISLMIAGEVFHRMPMYKSYGAYPADTAFDGFRVSYQNDLAEMVTPEKFLYTNNTNTSPATSALQQIAGAGNSPIVKYEGTGAYFLDKIREGVWRLEVMPDAIWLNDPFGRNSLKKTVAVVNWRTNNMQIDLPVLGSQFKVTPLNEGNQFKTGAVNGAFSVSPGAYLLVKEGVSSIVNGTDTISNIFLNEFSAPAATLTNTTVLHEPPVNISAGNSVSISAVVAAVQKPEKVELHIWNGFRSQVIDMQASKAYHYNAIIPASLLTEGYLRYYIAVKDLIGYTTFPSGTKNSPKDWDFYDVSAYKVPVVAKSSPVYLFDAFKDAGSVARNWIRTSAVVPGGPGKSLMTVNVEKLFVPDAENRGAAAIYDYSMRYSFADDISFNKADLGSKQKLVLLGKALNSKPCMVQLALITADGVAFGGTVNVDTLKGDYAIALNDLKQVKTVLLPRPYPSFLSYYFSPSINSFDLSKIETLQISIGPGIPETQLKDRHGLAIESIRLE
ncbi:MAG: membrane or secreted protein [Bacteroidota bacterium]